MSVCRYVLLTSFLSSRLKLGSSKYLVATLACGRSGEITLIYHYIGNIPLLSYLQEKADYLKNKETVEEIIMYYNKEVLSKVQIC